jgi:hypothetical protein
MASENFALILAVGSTPVGWGVGGVVSAGVGGTVLTTVGAPGAAQAIPAARSSATAIVVKSSSVFLMIFLSSHVFRALRDRFRSAYPDCECVKVTPGTKLSTPPPEAAKMGRALCPEGYLPRRRRRVTYQLRGKEVVTSRPPKSNPEPPPGFLGSRPRLGQNARRLQELEEEESKDELITPTHNEPEKEPRSLGEKG